MARHGITFEDIAHAAQQLMAQGKSLTIENIRSLTGTGSSSTIAIHLRQFKAQLNETNGLVSKENLPEELVYFIKGLWQKVMTQAEEQINTVKAEVADEMEGLKKQGSQLLEENAKWQQQNHTLAQEKASLMGDKIALEQINMEANKTITGLQATQLGLNQQLEDKQTHVEDLKKQNAQVQANLEHFREATREQRLLDQEKYENEQRQLKQLILETEHMFENEKQAYHALEAQYEKMDREKDGIEAQLEKTNSLFEYSKTHTAKLEKDVEKTELALQVAQQNTQQLQSKLNELQSQHGALQQKSIVTAEQLHLAQAKLTELTNQHQFQSQEKWELMQEKAMLEGQLKQLQLMVANTNKG